MNDAASATARERFHKIGGKPLSLCPLLQLHVGLPAIARLAQQQQILWRVRRAFAVGVPKLQELFNSPNWLFARAFIG